MSVTKQVAVLLPKMATDLPGCGEPDKLATLQRCLGDFCMRSRVWREDLVVSMAADALTARLAWTCNGRAISIEKLLYDGVYLAFGRSGMMRITLGEDTDGTQLLTMSQSPLSGVAWTLTVSGTVVPSVAAEAPDWVLDNYGDTIVSGAMAILKMHKGKPYSDPAGVQFAANEFRRGIAYACMDGARRVGKGAT